MFVYLTALFSSRILVSQAWRDGTGRDVSSQSLPVPAFSNNRVQLVSVNGHHSTLHSSDIRRPPGKSCCRPTDEELPCLY